MEIQGHFLIENRPKVENRGLASSSVSRLFKPSILMRLSAACSVNALGLDWSIALADHIEAECPLFSKADVQIIKNRAQ